MIASGPPAALLILLLPVVAAAAAPLELGGGVEPDPNLDAIYTRFTAAYSDLDADDLAQLYARDAKYVSPGGGVRLGREAIRESFARMFSRAGDRGEHLDISFRIVARTRHDDWAYDVGFYRLERTVGGESVHLSAGKFVVVAEPDDAGTWRFSLDTYTDVDPEDLE